MALSKDSGIDWTDVEEIKAPRTKEDSQREMKKVNRLAGIRLYSLIPIIFPGFNLVESYKAEHDRIKETMFRRYWMDNGPWALRRAMHHYNLIHKFCTCAACRSESLETIPCAFWTKFIDFARSAGLTVCVMHPTMETHPEVVIAFKKARYVEMDSMFHAKPEGFDCMTACKYMAPVSYKGVHLVFQRMSGGKVTIAYGRQLWEVEDLADNESIKKLDCLLARLRP